MSRVPGPPDPRRPVQRPGHRGPGPVGDPALDLGDHLRHDGPRGRLRGLRHDPAERQQRADQVHVRLDALEHLLLKQQLPQVQPVDGVPLHDLHHRGREVPADVAEPPGDARRGRAEPAGTGRRPPAAPAARPAVRRPARRRRRARRARRRSRRRPRSASRRRARPRRATRAAAATAAAARPRLPARRPRPRSPAKSLSLPYSFRAAGPEPARGPGRDGGCPGAAQDERDRAQYARRPRRVDGAAGRPAAASPAARAGPAPWAGRPRGRARSPPVPDRRSRRTSAAAAAAPRRSLRPRARPPTRRAPRAGHRRGRAAARPRNLRFPGARPPAASRGTPPPRPPCRGRYPDGQRRAEPRRRFRPGQRPGVGEHPGHPPGHQPVHVPPPGDPAKRVDPPLPGTRASAGR